MTGFMRLEPVLATRKKKI